MKKAIKLVGKVFLGFLLFSFIYWFVISFPQLFFKSEKFENLYIYHHGSSEISAVGQKALVKIKKSSLYNPNAVYRVYLTNSAAEYAFFTNYFHNTGGGFSIFANGNIFIRPSLIEEDRLINPSGNIVAEDRPLNYFIAHETTHAMEYDKLGFSKYLALNEWIREGIADKTGRDKFDFDEMLENYKNNAPMMDRWKSGLYLKYQLLVEYSFKYKSLDTESLLEQNPTESEIEAELQKLQK